LGLKPKDLVGIPWRVAFALQADGWYLRSDVVWAKPNALPESVRDRPSRNHEYLFLLARSERYFYDSLAINEPCQSGPSDIRKMLESLPRIGGKHTILRDPLAKASAATNLGRRCAVGHPDGHNRRTVWTIATAPYRGAHFATFPPALVEPCIRAGTSERGCCARCGAPWQRETSVFYRNPGRRTTNGPRSLGRRHETAGFSLRLEKQVTTVGWRPTCACSDGEPIPCTVLDPFAGSGTTLIVARKLGRYAVGIELKPEYESLIQDRCREQPSTVCAA
jgi:DNA modification methylase